MLLHYSTLLGGRAHTVKYMEAFVRTLRFYIELVHQPRCQIGVLANFLSSDLFFLSLFFGSQSNIQPVWTLGGYNLSLRAISNSILSLNYFSDGAFFFFFQHMPNHPKVHPQCVTPP